MNYRVLGPLEIVADDGAVLPMGKRMERALFALLVMRVGEVCSVDLIIEALWPDGPPPRVDASLHSVVARLRRTLSPDRSEALETPLLVRRSPGYLLLANDDDVDARRFEQAAQRGHALARAGEPAKALHHLDVALAEWRGPAFAEFAYEPFVDREAARLEELRLEATEVHLGVRLELGDTHLVPELEQSVVAYPLREHFWEYLLVALYRGGRHADALRRASEVRAVLSEVGLAPSPKLQDLEYRILHHDPTLLRGEVPRATVAPTVTTSRGDERPRWWNDREPFVGRASELDAIDRAWQTVRDGEVLCHVVVGEPGIGKSYLAMEAANRASDDGALVLAGRCAPEGSVPFEPFVEALGRLVDAMSNDQIEALGEHAERLARLLPLHGSRLGVPQVAPAATDVERYLLFEAVAELLATRATCSPIVLVVDDVQWADDAALRLLDHLLRSERSTNLLVLVSAREADLNSHQVLRTYLDRWLRDHVAVEISLGGFSESEVDEVLTREGTDTDQLAETLHSITGGNPFFVVEMARAMDTTKAVRPTPDTLPPTVHALVRTRLDQLGSDAVDVLGVAALVGSQVDASLIDRVLHGKYDVAACLDAAVAAGLLVERADTLVFRHELVRSTLTNALGPVHRAGMHRRIVESLLERGDALEVAIADQLARHAVAAAADGDARDAVLYSLIAGDRAVAGLAYDTAVARYQAGIDALCATQVADPVGELSLRLALAEATRLGGDADAAARATVEALPLAVQLGDTRTRRLAAWSLAHAIAPRSSRVDAGLAGQLEALHACIRNDAAASENDEALIAQARATLVMDCGYVESALELSRRALSVLGPKSDPPTLALTVHHALFVVGERLGLDERLRVVGMALAAVEGSNDPEAQLLAFRTARWMYLTAGDLAGAKRYEARLAGMAEQLGMPRYLADVAQCQASSEILQGRLAEAETHAAEVLLHRPDGALFEGYVAQLGLIRIAQGRALEVVSMLDSIELGELTVWTTGAALVHAECGDRQQAQTHLTQLIDHLPSLDRDVNWLATHYLGARLAHMLGDDAAAGALVSALEPHATRVAMGGAGAVVLGPVALVLGELLGLLGDGSGAEQHLGDVDSFVTGLGAQAIRAQQMVATAEVVSRLGGAARRTEVKARAHQAVALVEHHRLGGSLAKRAARLLTELG